MRAKLLFASAVIAVLFTSPASAACSSTCDGTANCKFTLFFREICHDFGDICFTEFCGTVVTEDNTAMTAPCEHSAVAPPSSGNPAPRIAVEVLPARG